MRYGLGQPARRPSPHGAVRRGEELRHRRRVQRRRVEGVHDDPGRECGQIGTGGRGNGKRSPSPFPRSRFIPVLRSLIALLPFQPRFRSKDESMAYTRREFIKAGGAAAAVVAAGLELKASDLRALPNAPAAKPLRIVVLGGTGFIG